MRKTYQFRIYPGRKQEVVLNRTLTTCRHLYNDSLAERKRKKHNTNLNGHVIPLILSIRNHLCDYAK